jgi:hypothetical protein
MLNYNLKKVVLITLIFSLAFGFVYAQKPPMKALERIQSLKKIKLLEVLELNEAESDKFIVKYNEYEKNVLDKYKQLEEASEELHKAILDEDYKNIDKLNENYINANKELNQAIQDKYENVKKLLPKEKFAKYLIFERRFQNELRKQIFKRMGEKDGDEPPKRRKKYGDY